MGFLSRLAIRFLSKKEPARAEIVPDSPSRQDLLDAISVPAELTPEMRTSITHMLTDSLLKSAIAIPHEKISMLQQDIQDSTFGGHRSDSTAMLLQTKYGVPPGDAHKLASYATSLVMSKYREIRYRRIGCSTYTWSTARDERVCPRCRALDGKTISWSNPPEGGHPGECECWRYICPDYAKVPVGRLDSRCPNCQAELAKRPRAKAKCKACQKAIWVRKNAQGQQVLLSEDMLANFERQQFGPEVCRCTAIPVLEFPE